MNIALRQGAIRLACMHPDDQQWILDNLPPSERAQLEEMLEEISLLGLANDPAVVETVMREPPPVSTPDPLDTFDRGAHPFWLALGLRSLPEDEQVRQVQKWPGKAGMAKWRQTFGNEVVPPALAQQLAISLRPRDSK